MAAQLGVEVGERLVEEQTCGSSTSARATATRCCWPPESSEGKTFLEAGEADEVAALAARAHGFRACEAEDVRP